MTRRRRIPEAVREAFRQELSAAREAANPESMWRALERAHILSQPWPWPHTVAHWRMLSLALRHHDRHEAIGQVVRLAVAAPGSATGRYPRGNTGRATVGLGETMPIPDDLAQLLASEAPSVEANR